MSQSSPPAFSPHFTYALSGIVETTAQWRFIRCNQAALSTLQRSVAQMQATPMDAWFLPERAPEAEMHFSLLRMQGLSHSQLSLPAADGMLQWLDISSVQADDDLYIHFINNITHEKEQDHALRAALDLAEQATEAKSAFLATVSHEIRTPLNGVLGLTQLCLQAEVPPAVRQNLEKIARSGQTLLRLINDLLDFSKLDAGQMAFVRERYDLWELLDDLATTVSHSQPGKALELAFVLDPELPRYLLGDRHRLTQVLTNLVGNAVKFTEQGYVSLALQRAGTANRPLLRATVEDSGPGMTADVLAQLFQPFTQGDQLSTRQPGGTGLGLVIARNMAQGMGGDLSVTSTPGAGSAFHLELPLEPAPAERQNTLDGCAGLKVGLQAPTPLTMHALECAVRSLGCTPVADSTPNTQAVLHDLPTAQAARHYTPEATQPGEPVRLLSVDAQDATALLQRLPPEWHGRVLTRPVTPLALLHALQTTNPQPQPNPVWDTPQEFAGACIAVAEDVPINQDVIRGLLDNAGIRVLLAKNGAELLALLDIEPNAADLVLMDVHMPVMDGLSATQALRKRGYTRPIVALSAGMQADEQARCEQAGMSDFLSKPIDTDELWGTLTRWLPPRRQTPVKRTPAMADEPMAMSDADWQARWAACGIDVEEALPRFLHRPEALQRAMHRFLQQHAPDGQLLQTSLANGDWERVRQMAHALRGGAAAVGATRLSAAAANLETLALEAPIEPRDHILGAVLQALAQMENAILFR